MNLKRVITPETVALDLKSTTKDGILEELTDLLAASGKIKDREAVLQALRDREAKMSTGMQNGIAIPHGKTDSVATLVTALGVKRDGVDFGSLDGKPSTLFIATVSPDSRTGPHIQFLAEVSRRLNDPTTRERALAAQTKDELINLLAE